MQWHNTISACVPASTTRRGEAGHNHSASSVLTEIRPAMASKADPYAGIEFEEINEATGEDSGQLSLVQIRSDTLIWLVEKWPQMQ